MGRNFFIEGRIYLKLRSQYTRITLGDNVSIYGSIDLRTRENGSIIIDDHVSFDDDVRIVAAQQATVRISSGCEVGCRTIINAGADVNISNSVLIGPGCVIQSSNHLTSGVGPIKGNGYEHFPISIHSGSWLAAYVIVLPGTTIGRFSVIGAGSIVTNDQPEFSISVGSPSRVIRTRTLAS